MPLKASGFFSITNEFVMPKVICKLPNASLNINGVNFTPTADKMAIISEEISDAVTELFLSIPGYEAEPDLTVEPPLAVKTSPVIKTAQPAKAPASATKKEVPATPDVASAAEQPAAKVGTPAPGDDETIF